MTQLLSLFGEDEEIRDIRGDDDLGFLPVPGMATALAIRALRRRKQGKRGKKLLFGEEDLRGDDDLGFLPVPGMATFLALRALKRKRQGKKGKKLFFGEEDLRGYDDIEGDLRGEDEILGFAATGAAVATGIFKGLKKFKGSQTFKNLQKSKLGKKLSIKKKKAPAKKGTAKTGSAAPGFIPEQFKQDFKEAVQASDMTVVPKAAIQANEEALQMLTEANEKSSAGLKKLVTPKNIAIGGGALVGTVVLLKILTRKKAVPVQVGLGTYRGCR